MDTKKIHTMKNAGSEEAATSPDELLEAYVNENIWPMYTQITSQAVSYDYGTGSVMGLDGVLGVHKADLDGDTLPELLVIRVSPDRSCGIFTV